MARATKKGDCSFSQWNILLTVNIICCQIMDWFRSSTAHICCFCCCCLGHGVCPGNGGWLWLHRLLWSWQFSINRICYGITNLDMGAYHCSWMVTVVVVDVLWHWVTVHNILTSVFHYYFTFSGFSIVVAGWLGG